MTGCSSVLTEVDVVDPPFDHGELEGGAQHKEGGHEAIVAEALLPRPSVNEATDDTEATASTRNALHRGERKFSLAVKRNYLVNVKCIAIPTRQSWRLATFLLLFTQLLLLAASFANPKRKSSRKHSHFKRVQSQRIGKLCFLLRCGFLSPSRSPPLVQPESPSTV